MAATVEDSRMRETFDEAGKAESAVFVVVVMSSMKVSRGACTAASRRATESFIYLPFLDEPFLEEPFLEPPFFEEPF
jgi:hypothetical protein